MPDMLHVSYVVFVFSSDADRLVWLLFCRYPPTPASIPSAAPRDTDHKRLVAPESINLQGLQTPVSVKRLPMRGLISSLYWTNGAYH
ncbi:hypothetical protein V8C43DRAFT_289979 [Trichoderma afarasin]